MSATTERRRSLITTRAGLVLLGLVLFFSACSGSPPDDPAVARASAAETVRAFLGALSAGDAVVLSSVAPGLNLTEDRVAGLQAVLAGRVTEVDPDQVTLNGSSATAVLVVGNGTEGDAARILVPLEWSNEQWVIGDRITVEQRLDVVPLRDPE